MRLQATQYRPAELAFAGPRVAPAPDRDPLVVEFAHEGDGGSLRVPGFWDGRDRYRVRFAAPDAGRWTWRTHSLLDELEGRTGTLDVSPAPEAERGPVRVSGGFHFAHADGTPFRPVGATIYNWLHQPDELQRQSVDAIAEAGFTKLRFMVFPQAGDHVEHHPTLLPFKRSPDGRWDPARPVPEFFERLDRSVELLASRKIQAEPLLLSTYDGGHYGLDTLTEEEDATYLRYVVARLAAHPGLWWSLANEYDILAETRPDDRWTRAGQLVAACDPYGHPRSIHNWLRLYDHNQAWVTHASVQLGQATEDFGRASLLRDAYRKPVILDEICYEGDLALRWGNLTAEELVHRFWIATVSGCYASHGESFLLDDGSLHIVSGGAFRGESPPRLGFLRRNLDEVPAPGLDPIDPWWDDAFVAGIPGRHYLQYLGRSAPAAWTFRLPQGHRGDRLRPGQRYAVDVIDTWDMTVTPVDRLFELAEVRRNDATATDPSPIALPAGRPLALRIRRLD